MKLRLALLPLLSLAATAAAPAPARPAAAPDLVVAVVAGSGTQVTIRVRNRGNAPAPAALLNLSLGNPIGTATNHPQPALPAGAVNSVIIPVNQPVSGVHYTVRLDVTKVIAESNESNNVAAGDFP
jgi:subtilase family serine protease